MADENLIAKVRKLLALAESPNEHEAALAAERAQELMLRYGIEIAQVAASRDEQLGVAKEKLSSTLEPWRRWLAGAVAGSMGGDMVYRGNSRRGGEIEFWGERGTVAGIVALYEYLDAQLTTISAVATARRAETWIHARTYRTSFLYGAVTRLEERFDERKKALEEQSVDNSTALVLMRDAVADALNDAYPKLQQNSESPSVHPLAAFAGERAADSVDLGDESLGRGPATEIGAGAG